MKIEIKKKYHIFYVTKKYNLFERILGKKEITERYKTNNEKFLHFQTTLVFYKSDGSIVSVLNDMCSVLNNYVRSF